MELHKKDIDSKQEELEKQSLKANHKTNRERICEKNNNELFRKKYNERKKGIMRVKRTNPEYKKKENEKKQRKRRNEEFRKKENEIMKEKMQEKRKNEQFRLNERISDNKRKKLKGCLNLRQNLY